MTDNEKLEKIRQYVKDIENDKNSMVIEQEMAQDILNILNDLPANTRGEELLKNIRQEVPQAKMLESYTDIVNKKVWIMCDLKNTDLYDLFDEEIAEPEVLDYKPMTTEFLTKEQKDELERLKNTIRHELKTANVVQVIPRN